MEVIPGDSVVYLSGTAVTDAELVHLKGLSINSLNLDSTKVTDAGLVHLKGLTNLTSLGLGRTQVTDAGLVHLAVAHYWRTPEVDSR